MPDSWGSHWFPALAAAKDGRGTATIAVVGDSVAEGLYASDLSRTSWAELLRTSITGAAASGGSGFQGMSRSETFIDGFPAGASTHYKAIPGDAWAQTGTWRTPTWPYGPGYGALVGAASGSTVTASFTGTELTIDYADRGSDWSYSVDGRRSTKIIPGTSDAQSSIRVPGLSSGTHQVVITALGTDGPWLEGITGANDRGVRLDNYSIAGLESGSWNNADSQRSGEFAGGIRNPADLIIYTLGGNDILKAVRTVAAAPVAGKAEVAGVGWQTIDAGRLVTGPGIEPGTTVVSVDPDTSVATLSRPATSSSSDVALTVTAQDVINAWRSNVLGYLTGLQHTASAITPDIVFLWVPASGNPQTETLYAQLIAQSRTVAASLGAAVIDVQAATAQPWSAWCAAGRAGNENDPSKSGADGVHPSDAGHRYIADLILKAITPQ
jgi:lysophospholipase L1-like esterase